MPPIDPTVLDDPVFHAALADVETACREADDHRKARMMASPIADACSFYREYKPKADAVISAISALAAFLPQLAQVPKVFQAIESVVDGFCPPGQ